MKRIRVGAVSYLNTKPLIEHLAELAPEIDLVSDVPSQLALDLEEGRLDVGLIPAIEYFRVGNYTILPGISISSYGPVLSVKLCSKVPFAEIRRLALDEGSRTSIALTDILLHHLFDAHPATEPYALYKQGLDSSADAILVIGDRAMRIPDGAYPFTLDIGYEWSRWTGLPCVFAFWALAPGVVLPANVQQAFHQAKEMGRREIPRIARQEAARLGIEPAQCEYYLSRVIRHDLGDAERLGLAKMYELAVERGLAPPGVSCVYADHGDLAARR